MELGNRIKQYRAARGWSQDDLAEKAYVSRQTISNWENDKSYPDLQSLLLLGSLFGLSLDQLVKGTVVWAATRCESPFNVSSLLTCERA